MTDNNATRIAALCLALLTVAGVALASATPVANSTLSRFIGPQGHASPVASAAPIVAAPGPSAAPNAVPLPFTVQQQTAQKCVDSALLDSLLPEAPAVNFTLLGLLGNIKGGSTLNLCLPNTDVLCQVLCHGPCSDGTWGCLGGGVDGICEDVTFCNDPCQVSQALCAGDGGGDDGGGDDGGGTGGDGGGVTVGGDAPPCQDPEFGPQEPYCISVCPSGGGLSCYSDILPCNAKNCDDLLCDLYDCDGSGGGDDGGGDDGGGSSGGNATSLIEPCQAWQVGVQPMCRPDPSQCQPVGCGLECPPGLLVCMVPSEHGVTGRYGFASRAALAAFVLATNAGTAIPDASNVTIENATRSPTTRSSDSDQRTIGTACWSDKPYAGCESPPTQHPGISTEYGWIYCTYGADCETSGTNHVGIWNGHGNAANVYGAPWRDYLQWYAGIIMGCPEQACWGGQTGEKVDTVTSWLGDAAFNQQRSPSEYFSGHGSSCSAVSLDDWQCKAEGGYGGYVRVED